MKDYILQYTLGDKQVQVRVPGDFALWREDAGFRSENLMDQSLTVHVAGEQHVSVDDEGITSVIRVQPFKL